MQINLCWQKADQRLLRDSIGDVWFTKGYLETFVRIDMFIILIGMIVSWMYTCVKTHENVYLIYMYNLLYASIKLYFKIRSWLKSNHGEFSAFGAVWLKARSYQPEKRIGSEDVEIEYKSLILKT